MHYKKRMVLWNAWKNDGIGRWSNDLSRSKKNLWIPLNLTDGTPDFIQCVHFATHGSIINLLDENALKRFAPLCQKKI